jgi:hypothetical protein
MTSTPDELLEATDMGLRESIPNGRIAENRSFTLQKSIRVDDRVRKKSAFGKIRAGKG